MSISQIPEEATEQFLSGFGVNIHVDTAIDGNAYDNVQGIIADLAYLGIDNVRDDVPSVGAAGMPLPAAYTELVDAGLKFDFCVGASQSGLPAIMANLDAVEQQYPGAIAAIEGPNEINYFPFSYDGQTGQPAAIAFQTDLYQAVKADPLLSAVPVVDFTGGFTNEPVAGLADYANIHPYPWNGDQPDWYIAANNSTDYGTTTPGPEFVTEAGYNTDPGAVSGVNNDAQAKMTLNLLMDTAQAGISTTYLYELLDENADPTYANPGQHWGLFYSDGTPKPAAVAIHNLSAILTANSAQGSGAVAGGLAYTISGLADDGNSMLLEKSPGVFDLIVWAEPPIWDSSTQTENSAPADPVTIKFGNSADTETLFDPLQSASAMQITSGVGQVTFDVTDHPIILEISANERVSSQLVACYCPGTQILTPHGEMPIEKLEIGHMVTTLRGEEKRIRWIGRRSYSERFVAANEMLRPIRVQAGTIGGSLPRRDLLISPEHAVFLDGYLVPARHLLNGSTISREPASRVDYIHLELDEHEIVLAEGCPSETFINDGSRQLFHNASSYADLYGEDAKPPIYYAPRLTDGFALERIRRELATVADELAQAA